MNEGGALDIQPVKRAYQQVADQLREMIISGELRVGERLPTETELCERFKTSRSTVREALRILASQSLIDTRPGAGGGSSVASPQIEEISGFLTTALTLLAGTPEMPVAELLEARETLEIPAARMAAQRGTDDALEAIGRLVLNDSELVGRQEMFRANWEFHEVILKASGNRWLYAMAKPLFSSMQTRFVRSRATPSFWERVIDEHRVVQQAIARRDSAGAAEAMMAHLEGLAPFYMSIDQAVVETPAAVDGRD